MRNIAILALASMVVLGTTVALAETADTDNVPEAPSSSSYCMPCGGHKRDFSYHRSDEHNYNYSYVFGGITLTEQQRQQMWNLVKKQHLNEQSLLEMRVERQKMHELLTAKNFDEAAVRLQLEKIAKKNVELGVEIARIRNQIYQLLTPEQNALLQKRYETRIAQGMD
ncbi:Spy/CpxP family protein refolding chaperone [Xenorhabdus lircayensis]|uniref:Spy/CpxP family protein refolding chaperone n=1 Tax=Xenorhabdus lircayensis TaxID=2763499 RepID=A0ABS0U2A2_9GAMM|nr:Spy/CpxP family protein refolding chaperone [Xenorhabdus lircayensis]MBI6548012.1 Spy/CpxP family protein refolding chaperone [Xenorhabdus lircayensis]